MNEKPIPVPTSRKPFSAPRVATGGRVAVVTAGSFDLFIPNG